MAFAVRRVTRQHAGPRGRASPRRMHSEARDRRWTRRLGTTAALLACLVLATAAWAVMQARDGADGPELPVLVRDVLTHPDRHDDRRIRLSDQVQSVRGRFFTLGGDARSDQLLVYQPSISQEIITPQDAVDVTGRLTRFDPARFARRFGDSFDRYGDQAGRLVLVPDRIDPSVPDDGTAPA